MENIAREGEQFLGREERGSDNQGFGGSSGMNQDSGMGGQGQGYDNQSSGQGFGNDQQQQSMQQDNTKQSNSGGGGFMGNLKEQAGDAYVNQGINSFLTKEGVPSGMDGAIDGVVDTEVNKFEKDF